MMSIKISLLESLLPQMNKRSEEWNRDAPFTDLKTALAIAHPPST